MVEPPILTAVTKQVVILARDGDRALLGTGLLEERGVEGSPIACAGHNERLAPELFLTRIVT